MLPIQAILLFALVFVLYVLSSIKILAEYERGVIFRLGKLLPQPKGPGVILVFAPIDRIVRVSLRTIVMDVPPQDVITRDNVSVKVNAVVYFRVMDPRRAIVEVENYHYATSQLAQTTLRSVLGQCELDDLLSERDRLNRELQEILDQTKIKHVIITEMGDMMGGLKGELINFIVRRVRKMVPSFHIPGATSFKKAMQEIGVDVPKSGIAGPLSLSAHNLTLNK